MLRNDHVILVIQESYIGYGTLFLFSNHGQKDCQLLIGSQVYHHKHISRKLSFLEKSLTRRPHFKGARTQMPLKSRTELKIGLSTVPTEHRSRFPVRFFLAQIKSCPRVYAI